MYQNVLADLADLADLAVQDPSLHFLVEDDGFPVLCLWPQTLELLSRNLTHHENMDEFILDPCRRVPSTSSRTCPYHPVNKLQTLR